MNPSKSNYSFDSSSLNEMKQKNAIQNLKYFRDSNEVNQMNAANKCGVHGIFTNERDVNSQMKQLFKLPSLNSSSIKKTNIKNSKSPSRRVQTGRVRNELKTNQPKLSLIPRPSFINSNKLLHCSRSTQLNARKELIKKMVFLAECTLKENKVNEPTPVKVLAGLTPKKTPRAGTYFMLPEFKKKVPKLEEIRSPIEDFIKKEMFSYSAKPLNKKSPTQSCEKKTCASDSKSMEEMTKNLQNLTESKAKLNEILLKCKLYSTEVTSIHDRIRNLDETFENRLNEIPEYKVYNEFCRYQMKKQDLYTDLRLADEELRNSITNKLNVSNKLKAYVKRREELLGKEINLLKNFEQTVQSTLVKYDESKEKGKNIEEKIKDETPQLRRSLRLSKISKRNEKTPLTIKQKKLDTKSRGIQKGGRI